MSPGRAVGQTLTWLPVKTRKRLFGPSLTHSSRAVRRFRLTGTARLLLRNRSEIMVPQTTSPVLSVYLVEDSDLLASRIRKALENEPGVHVVGRSADAQDAIAAITELEPDLAIVDLS